MLARSRCLAAAVATLALIPASTGAAVKPAPNAAVAPNFDIRATMPAPPGTTTAEKRAAADALRAEAGPDADARVNRQGVVRSIAARGRPLTPPDGADRATVARRFLARHHAAFGLDAGDVRALVATREAASPGDRLVHLDFRQQAGGIPVFGTGVRVHLTTRGEIVSVSSSAVKATAVPAPAALDVVEAVEIAVSHVRPDLAATPRLREGPRGPARESVFERGPFKSDLVAALTLFPMRDELRTAWQVVVEPPGFPQKYDVLIDGRTGELLYRRNRVLYGEGTGKVLQSDQTRSRDPRLPDESPLGSGPGDPLGAPGGCPPVSNHVSRSLTASFLDPGSVLFDTGRLAGNNTHVFRFAPGIEGATGGAAPAGWTFDFEFGSAGSSETQLFFVSNFLHDFFYDLGFDEAAGNFQADNFGRGGAGGDALSVVARADGRNNATFEPAPDGQSPVMSMFLWDGTGCWSADMDGDGTEDLDGGFDSDIVIHEFHHGVSTRLNPFWSGDEADAMGEGGSDFFAYSINGDTTLAEFSYPPTGIRVVNGRTYGSWDCLLGFFCEPHDNGEIWANVLWDLRERYRADLVGGSEAAAVRAAHLLYVDGLKLSPPSPTMLDMRDAMLQADRLRYPSNDPGGSENACRTWEVFALRGMGAGALDTLDTGTNTVIESTALPPACPALPAPATVTLAASDASASEAGPEAGSFTITRSGDTARALTVYLGSPSGSAGEGIDYAVLPATVTIAANTTSASVPVVPIDDDLVEPNETATLSLLGGPGYRVGPPASATITIASDDVAPDLVVSMLTGPSVGGAGASIAVVETTKNQGNGAGGTSVTQYYLSSNTAVDAGDTVLGSREVVALGAGATSSATITLTVPPETTTGAYYVVAQADAGGSVGESQEGNNTRAFLLRVGPDLAVSALTVPTLAAAGATISISDTTKNQGGGAAGATATGFYLSANAVLDASDVLLGWRAAPSLAAGETQNATTSLTIPASTAAGTWYLHARADHADAVVETQETNNVTSRQFQVGPDLVVSAMTGPANAAAGASVTVNDTTKNQGGAGSAASVTRFYLSADTTLGADDASLGTRSVGPLAAGASSSAATTLTIPSGTATGTYYLVARADADGTNIETSETNNEKRLSVRIGPDLVVSSVVAPAMAAPGGTISVTNAVKNQGGGAAVPCAARIFLSANSVLDTFDVLLGSRAVPALAAGATSSVATSVTLPAGMAAGLYYVVVQADAAGEVVETSETNNTGTAQMRLGPDFTIASASATPINTAAGATVTVSETTSNSGGAAGPATTTSIYLSADTVLDAGDTLVGSRSVPALAAGATSSANTLVTIPPGTASGAWQLVVAADAGSVAVETSETNNTRTSYVRVGPDLKVATGKGPTSATAGAPFSVTSSITNAGGAQAPASTTHYYLSTNTALDAADVLLGSSEVVALAAGATGSAQVTLAVPAGAAPARYYLVIVADGPGTIPEVYENNNTLAVSLTVK